MQVANKKDIQKRIMFYWGKLFTSSITSGEEYSELEKTIVIIFIDFELDNLNHIQKYLTKWGAREEDYSKTLLTDVMEIYIIELPKFKKYGDDGTTDLSSWVKFINNPEVIDMSEKKEAIKKAKEILEEISSDEHERELAEYREKYIMDQMSFEEYGFDIGFDKGVKQGLEQGLEQARKEKEEMVKSMYKNGIDTETIVKISNLTQDEIQVILKETLND